METNCLTDKQFWMAQSSCFQPFMADRNEFAPILERYLPVNSVFTCAEIGAYPGAYLCYLSKRFQYQPTAIDFRDDIDHVSQLFEFNGVNGLTVINSDFFEVKNLQFDVVASFGFVEHFKNYQKVIKRHVEITKPGGYLIISVPHFWGMQGILRKMFFKKEAVEEIYRTHNLQIMHLNVLIKALKNLEVDILFANYAMGGDFWVPYNSPKVKSSYRGLLYFYNKMNELFFKKLPSSCLYSPVILTISKTKNS
jgi:SAM-dependent methyltransferase